MLKPTINPTKKRRSASSVPSVSPTRKDRSVTESRTRKPKEAESKPKRTVGKTQLIVHGKPKLKAKAPVKVLKKKRKAVEEEQPSVKRKVKRKKKPVLGTPVVTDAIPQVTKEQGRASGLTVQETKVLNSRFGASAPKILELIEMDDFDGSQALMYKSLTKSIVGILPYLEGNVRKSKGTKGAYQFNQTVSQLRETIADVQAARDRSLVGQQIVTKHVKPAMMSLANQMTLAFMQVENQVNALVSEREYRQFKTEFMRDLTRGIAQHFQAQLDAITENISQELS